MMNRKTLQFEQITDSRFDTNIEELLDERIKKLEDMFANIPGVTMRHTGKMMCYCTMDKDIQYRALFHIQKTTRKYTWNDIYKMINSVKAVPYEFVKLAEMNTSENW